MADTEAPAAPATETPAPAASAPAAPAASSAPSTTGRKVFFLYPTVAVQSQVVSELAQLEYEVYMVKDHINLARILENYTDSVVYINIDDKIPEPEWEKWIAGLLQRMPNLQIGVLSGNSDEALRNKYINELHITCGFLFLKLDMSRAVEKISAALDAVNAKGRRKFIRAAIDKETNATINIPHGTGFMKGNIKDVSVVGFSCTFEADPGIKKNEFFKDIQIRLQTMLLKVEAVVFGSRMEGEEKIYVFLFTQRIDPNVRTKIRTFIQSNLQGKIDKEIN